MRKLKFVPGIFVFLSLSLLLLSFGERSKTKDFAFPYKQAGLTERQAAAHLISRFTFGATPGLVDEVVKTGLEKWFQQQLTGGLPDDSLNFLLKDYDALQLSNAEIVKIYPRRSQVLRMAIKDGQLDKNAISDESKKETREELMAYMQKNGMKPVADLYRQLISQKILRAAYSHNQLHEILTDFWFNHFNVSLTKNECAPFVLSYEKDLIRPNVAGNFENLLLATAKSPAMLTYLDNFKSAVSDDEMMNDQKQFRDRIMARAQRKGVDSLNQDEVAAKIKNAKKTQGLNENYAREIMELHTLGVDGGYTQTDVTQAARIFTGWTVSPALGYANANQMKQLEKRNQAFLKNQGFVHDGDFVFMASRHDKKEKKVLGVNFPGGGGYEEGLKLIQLLAHHPSTANFISTKLAVHFVSDHPSKKIIDKMAHSFLKSGGNISQVLMTMVSSPEFWDKQVIREKTKSPFELAISTVRSLDAEIKAPLQLSNWITKMGEKIYFYQAPTGFPDKGQYWINTGSLLNRMNFGLAVAAQRVPGLQVNLASLNKNREPESAEAALVTYAKLLMPERDMQPTIKRLKPLLSDPEIDKKIGTAADKANTGSNNQIIMADEMVNEDSPRNLKEKGLKKNGGRSDYTIQQMQTVKGNNSMLAQVVGIIIGSPEFQRK